jgi:hypothetical protein
MSDSFSSLTKELRKSRSLILAGKSALGTTENETATKIFPPSVGDPTTMPPVSVEAAEDSFPPSVCPDKSAVSGQEDYALVAERVIAENDLRDESSQEEYSGSNAQQHDPILIYSVGTVKQRYRMVKKKEEEREALKAIRFKRSNQVKPAPDIGRVEQQQQQDMEVDASAQLQYDMIVDNIKYSTVSLVFFILIPYSFLLLSFFCSYVRTCPTRKAL